MPVQIGKIQTPAIYTKIIAERLSTRQLIQLRISFCVCMYVCMYVCMSVTLRNANFMHTAHAQFGYP